MGIFLAFEVETHWLIWAACLALILLLLGLGLTFFLAEKSNQKYLQTLEEQSNSVRVFILDVKNDRVQYFNVTSLRQIRECTLGEFYQKFPVAEQKKVINWINAIVDPSTEVPEYLEADIQEHRTRRHYFSMLQVDAVDYKRQVVHLQSYLLKYMLTAKGESGRYHGLSTVKEVEEAMTGVSHKRGLTLAFRFAYKRIADKDREIELLVFNQIKNALFPFLQGKRYLLQSSGNELLLVDLRIEEKAKCLYLAHSCLNAINRYLSINGYASQIDVRCGAAQHQFFTKELNQIIDAASRLAEEAFEDKKPLLWYEKGHLYYSKNDENAYRTEVERIINEKKLAYKFRPVFAVKEGKILGYLAKADPLDTYFDSMEELKDYAMRTEDDRTLFHTVAKETIHRFLEERPEEEQCLFFPVRLSERGYMLLSFARLPKARSARLVLLFDETDLGNALDRMDDEDIVNDMRAIRAKGYSIGLKFSSGQLKLPPKVYTAFDYFVCSFAFAGSATEMDALLRSQLHSLVEKLLKYGRPIIASDIDGWPAVELLIRSGMDYISSDAFAPYDVMMNPIPPKTVKRVMGMKN